jgi:hypothetical protein
LNEMLGRAQSRHDPRTRDHNPKHKSEAKEEQPRRHVGVGSMLAPL